MLIFTAGANNVTADEYLLDGLPDLEISADTAVYSKYLWRGFALDNDPVVQSGVYAAYKGFTLSFWASGDIDNDDGVNSDELDFTAGYTHQFDKVSVSVGHIYYDFPGINGWSREFYIGAGLDVFLSPSLTYYHDYGHTGSGGSSGDYLVLDASHSVPLWDTPLSLELSGAFGYNQGLGISGEGSNLDLGAGIAMPLTEKLTLTPGINGTFPFGDLEDSNDGNQRKRFSGGFIMEYSF